MMKLPNLAGFEGLLDLDRRGIDIRPTLLRVLTDQYLQRAIHTPDEERQFTELALRLLDETDIATRAAVATRLAPHVSTPRAIIQQLGRDVLEVAEPILRYSPTLTPAELDAIASERGPCYAAIIARRGQAEPPLPAVATPPRDAEPKSAVIVRIDDAPAPRADAAETERPRVMPPVVPEPARDPEAVELSELFFAAGAPERRLILISLDYVAATAPHPPAAMQRADIWRLESAALQHKTEAAIQDIERALGISRQQARRIVNDDLGEPIVVAAKAMSLPNDVVQRILLFLNPRVGQSVDRVYELASLYSEITIEAARRLIAIWRDADPPQTQPASHDTQWRTAIESARQALAEVTRRAPVRREALHPNERLAAPARR